MGLILALTLSAQAFALTCIKNNGNQNIKTICLLQNSEQKMSGFLLFNANGTKSYLAVTNFKESGYGEQEFGHIERSYTVKSADSDLNVKGEESSVIKIVTSWQYSDGGTYLSGKTPGGRSINGTIESGDHE